MGIFILAGILLIMKSIEWVILSECKKFNRFMEREGERLFKGLLGLSLLKVVKQRLIAELVNSGREIVRISLTNLTLRSEPL